MKPGTIGIPADQVGGQGRLVEQARNVGDRHAAVLTRDRFARLPAARTVTSSPVAGGPRTSARSPRRKVSTQGVVQGDVRQVHVQAEGVDEPGLLVLAAPRTARSRPALRGGRDDVLADRAVALVDADGPALPSLGHDPPGAGRQVAPSSSAAGPGRGGVRVLTADLGQHPRSVRSPGGSARPSTQAASAHAPRHLDAETRFLGPVRASQPSPASAISSRVPPTQAWTAAPGAPAWWEGPGRGRRSPNRGTSTGHARRAGRRLPVVATLAPLSSTCVRPVALGLASSRQSEERWVRHALPMMEIIHFPSRAWKPGARAVGKEQDGWPRRRTRRRTPAARSSGWPTSCACTPRSAPRVRSLWSGCWGGSWVRGPATTAPSSTRKQTGMRTRPRPGRRLRRALLPAFVAADPYGAGVAAVLTNVGDLAAMGAAEGHRRHDRRDRRRRARGAARPEGRLRDVRRAPGRRTPHDQRQARRCRPSGRLSRRDPLRDASPQMIACPGLLHRRHDASRLSVLPPSTSGDRLAGDVRLLACLHVQVPASPRRTSAWPVSSGPWRCSSSGAGWA